MRYEDDEDDEAGKADRSGEDATGEVVAMLVVGGWEAGKVKAGNSMTKKVMTKRFTFTDACLQEKL